MKTWPPKNVKIRLVIPHFEGYSLRVFLSAEIAILRLQW
uniref:Uncharacterized protein n=1 Tax=Rhizophora mucronata TaxID=61149 RepID=A0A2P2MLW1_RHIMU